MFARKLGRSLSNSPRFQSISSAVFVSPRKAAPSSGYFLVRAVRPARPTRPKRSRAAELGSGVESEVGKVATKLSTSTLPVGEAMLM